MWCSLEITLEFGVICHLQDTVIHLRKKRKIGTFVKSKNIHQLLLSKHIYQLFVKLVKFGHIGSQLVTSIAAFNIATESKDMSAFIYIYVCVSHIQIQPSILQQNQMALMLQKNAKTTHLSTFCWYVDTFVQSALKIFKQII